MPGTISIRGARVHNLKNIDLDLPRERLVVITGVSGSGKSSLAFDTLFAEGQRRYLESLTADARQLLRQIERPDVDIIEGLSPAIAVQQQTGIYSARSTVGTITEIYDYLRLLFARIGTPRCLECGREISVQTIEQIVDQLLALPGQTRIMVLAPLRFDPEIDFRAGLQELAHKGFARVRLDGQLHDLASDGILDGKRPSTMDLVVDRLIIREGIAKRLADSLETAARFGDGIIKIAVQDGTANSTDLVFSQKFACVECGKILPEITPQLFSFNSPQGACPECGGLGLKVPRQRRGQPAPEQAEAVGEPCARCGGTGLKPEALAVSVGDKNIFEVASLSIADALQFFKNLALPSKQQAIAHKLLDEIISRLKFLIEVGVEYLTINRRSLTLSGGEAQRVRLATHIGSHLAGALYILDEPSIGLHPRDNERLTKILARLRDAGNTVIIVEHDRDTILMADDVVDMGPGAAVQGGEVVAHGTARELMSDPQSLTGQYLSGKKSVAGWSRRRREIGRSLTIKGAREQNLKNISVEIPLGLITCVTGVSGAGKSTLVMDILYPALANRLHRAKMKVGAFQGLSGVEYLDRVIGIDQAPIGRTPRSTPATFTGLYDPIREFFAQLPEARIRGYGADRFSFNVAGGRCEACQGNGVVRVDMYFLPEVQVLCEVCKGKRYARETLEVKYKGLSIADVLDLTVNQAAETFSTIPAVAARLTALREVGLGYIKLGQPASTLSGGESQRVKLARELARRSTGRTLYIMDEPTTGLHFEDIRRLLELLNHLSDAGNSVVIIEHNLDVIASADYVIDMGPGGGTTGGEVVATGTPEEIAQNPSSITGQYLKTALPGLEKSSTSAPASL